MRRLVEISTGRELREGDTVRVGLANEVHRIVSIHESRDRVTIIPLDVEDDDRAMYHRYVVLSLIIGAAFVE